MEKTFNITQAAEILGMSVKTLQRWDREGKLIAKRTPSNRRYYTREQLDDVCNTNENVVQDSIFDKMRSGIVNGCKIIILESDSYVKTKHLYDMISRLENTHSTTMTDGITECCGYDFGFNAFGKRKPKCCPMCGKLIK